MPRFDRISESEYKVTEIKGSGKFISFVQMKGKHNLNDVKRAYDAQNKIGGSYASKNRNK